MTSPPSPASGPAALRMACTVGGVLVIRLSVHSRMVAPAVASPALDDWVRGDGSIVPVDLNVAPAYSYLRPSDTARLTLTTALPDDLEIGEHLHGALRFPGIEEETLPIVVDVSAGGTTEAALDEHQVSVTLPLGRYDLGADGEPAGSSQAIVTLLAGLAGLEVIPARWLAAELITTVCEIGEARRKTEDGAAVLASLSRTRFMKNGALAFRGAHVTEWLLVGVTVSAGLHAAVSGTPSPGRMLHTWERWLLNLIDMDIETAADDAHDVQLPPPPLEDTIKALGTDAERWFAALVLGLMRLSPRIDATLRALCDAVPETAADTPQAQGTEAPDVLSEEGSLQR